MTPPRYRSVAVHWPRLLAGCAVMTGLLILAMEWEPLARIARPVMDSSVLTLLAIALLFAAVIGFGRPWAEYELSDHGIVRREGVIYSLFRTAHALPWEAVESAAVLEEMDGTRSFTIRTHHGVEWKVWEKFGTADGFDAFRHAVARRLEARPRTPGAPPPVQVRSVWDGAAARIVVGALAVGWLVLAVLTATGPTAGRGARVPKLLGMALILVPMLWRAFMHRRGTFPAGQPLR
ncbi:hypothetical protein [Longimicrobium sp.]|uniref:hypothetical protein n=1 Tax=Longimicrobium sp. TaxID=2029185 RepID=UPI003B3B48D4